MTNTQKLKLIHEILSRSGLAEGIDMDRFSKRPTTKREKEAAELLNLLYRIVHPSKKCPHPDWEAEAEKLYSAILL